MRPVRESPTARRRDIVLRARFLVGPCLVCFAFFVGALVSLAKPPVDNEAFSLQPRRLLSLHRGNIIAVGGQVERGGLMHRDAPIAAGNLSVSNRIGGDLTAAVGTVRLSSKAAVAGNLICWSRLPASIDPQAVVSGQTAVPFLGACVMLLAVLFGLEAVLLTKTDLYREAKPCG